jgi:hypothetical protein
MGMSPTATLTYGYDIESATGDWREDEEPVEAAGQVLRDAGFSNDIGVWQDYDGCRMRLFAAFLQASGYNDKGVGEGWDALLAAHMEAQGASVPGGENQPGWWLVSYWG